MKSRIHSILLAILLFSAMPVLAQKHPRPSRQPESVIHYTVEMIGDGHGMVTYDVVHTSLTAEQVLGHFFATYDRDVYINGVNLFQTNAEEKLKKLVDEPLFSQAKPFLERSVAYSKEIERMNEAAVSTWLQRSKDMAVVRKKYFSHYRSLGTDTEIGKYGIQKRVVEDLPDND